MEIIIHSLWPLIHSLDHPFLNVSNCMEFPLVEKGLQYTAASACVISLFMFASFDSLNLVCIMLSFWKVTFGPWLWKRWSLDLSLDKGLGMSEMTNLVLASCSSFIILMSKTIVPQFFMLGVLTHIMDMAKTFYCLESIKHLFQYCICCVTTFLKIRFWSLPRSQRPWASTRASTLLAYWSIGSLLILWLIFTNIV